MRCTTNGTIVRPDGLWMYASAPKKYLNNMKDDTRGRILCGGESPHGVWAGLKARFWQGRSSIRPRMIAYMDILSKKCGFPTHVLHAAVQFNDTFIMNRKTLPDMPLAMGWKRFQVLRQFRLRSKTEFFEFVAIACLVLAAKINACADHVSTDASGYIEVVAKKRLMHSKSSILNPLKSDMKTIAAMEACVLFSLERDLAKPTAWTAVQYLRSAVQVPIHLLRDVGLVCARNRSMQRFSPLHRAVAVVCVADRLFKLKDTHPRSEKQFQLVPWMTPFMGNGWTCIRASDSMNQACKTLWNAHSLNTCS